MFSPDFKNPCWLPGAHAQTLYAARSVNLPDIGLFRERWMTPDFDFIDIDYNQIAWELEEGSAKPLYILFHGLEGSSQSHYAKAFLAFAEKLERAAAIVHFRSCSGVINKAPRFYHAGDSAEIHWILKRFKTEHQGPLFATGISLGGNVLLRWLGEQQSAAIPILDAACVVSAPLDLLKSGMHLSRLKNRLYTRYFLRSLQKKCLLKLRQFPHLFDRKAMLNARTLYQFDDVVTAPLHGYHGVLDYWTNASAHQVLGDIKVPTLLLHAQNDPFLPLTEFNYSVSEVTKVELLSAGGHVGFVTGTFPGHLFWLPQRLMNFFESFLS